MSFDRPSRRGDVVVALLLFISCCWAFRRAPIEQSGGDSRYSILLSDNLLRHRDFALDRYNLPTSDYRLEDGTGGRYYAFPVGTSLLSVPYVAVMRLRGRSPVRDGSYSAEGERQLDARLAAILMAAFAAVGFLTARLILSVRWSLVVTVVSAFGTQVLSTTSRALWSDTWGILLVGAMVFLLLRSLVEERPPQLVVLGTLAAWAYIVRPTNIVALIGVAGYLTVIGRRRPWRYLIAATVWLGLFAIYSWRHFHRLVPAYYRAGRLEFDSVPAALFGNLISPSRGLLVCVPFVVAIVGVLIRYRSAIRFRPLAALAGFVAAGHLATLAGFGHWWGGHCYGARLTAGLVPWLVVLAILGADAWIRASAEAETRASHVALLVFAGALSTLSIGINAVGAFSAAARDWNVNPNIDETPGRLWSWRRPQFLAPWLGPVSTKASREAPQVLR